MNEFPSHPEAPDEVSPEEAVRNILRSHGFDRVGFARTDEVPGVKRFRSWLERGYAGSMGYLADGAEKRGDPRLVLAGTRSVITVSLLYPPPRQRRDDRRSETDARGTISTYARGIDYHRVLERRLKRSREELETRFDESFRYYVDSGPVLEKAWAERAGLGWIGKNACLIDREQGSYFFLGVILTTLELPPDEPALDHCGSCRACLDACPTDAFPEPYVLDARRCISYLTIEQRDEMPADLEPAVGDWIFGCDICQEVCPYNGDGERPYDPELGPRPENEAPDLTSILKLDETTFRERFPQSAVTRARLHGLLRNAVVALANSADPAALEILDTLREDPRFREDDVLRETLNRACKRLAAGR